MERRRFLELSGAGIANLAAAKPDETPPYRIVTPHRPLARPGMPGPFPGRVIRMRSAMCIDEMTNKVDATIVREMLDAGMGALTRAREPRDAWTRFFKPDDIVGIKVNCSGAPNIMSSPEIVAEVVRNLIAVGVRADRIHLYERFVGQMRDANYGPHLPAGVQQNGAEDDRGDNTSYDPFTYVDVDFFGEDDTRSNLIRLVSERFTKIINIPNVKDHGAAGATGCLKNIAYGSFSNVARSHTFTNGHSHTLSFIGTLASVEPLRSRTVLQIVDGLRGVWHGGPFADNPRYRFYPKQIMVGTDPVAIDRLILDLVEEKRRAEGARSIYDRAKESLGSHEQRRSDPNVNILIREPGHVAFAGKLGLGVSDKRRIKVEEIET